MRGGWPALRRVTPARIALGRSGTALPTSAQLDFQHAHARARDAVHATLVADRIRAELEELGLQAVRLRSAASDRSTYLRRPDLGRRLDDVSRERLLRYSGEGRNPDFNVSAGESPGPDLRRDDENGVCVLAFVVADGLSATAVNAHAVPLIKAVLPKLPGCKIRPIAVVEGGRVAIGDEIGGLLEANLVAVLIGERPGLSAADSLGVYVTWAPAPGAIDAARNCLSNIRPEGMPIAKAADALAELVASARRHRMTGVGLSRRIVAIGS